MTATKKQKTEIAAYKLTPELVKTVRIEAAQCGVWPATVVEERLRESFRNRPVKTSDVQTES